MYHSFDDPFPESDECVDAFCSLDDLPDAILTMPPPPIPFFMQTLLNESFSSEDCNLCRLFTDGEVESGNDFLLPRPSDKSSSPASDGMTSVLIASILGLMFGAFLLGLIWCKKWRHFPAKDSCPMFSDGLFSGHRKSAPPPPSPTESVISPVVNEKSPQSIIMDHGTGKKSVIQTKYWRRGSDFTIDASSSVLRPHRQQTDHYGGDGGSCTSSPVYAELDGVPIGGAQGTASSSLLMSCPGSSISPYAVGMNTYSELPENSMRMTNIASSSSAALLPDSSYDNAAYLPNMNPDQYGSRSLRRPRTGISGQPLLHSAGSHHQFNAQVIGSPGGPSVTHLTSGARKKSRHHQQQNLAHQLARSSVQRMQEIEQIDDLPSERNRFTARRSAASSSNTFVDGPMHSPSMTTFKSASPYASYSDRNRDRDSKRPLPPVPGIRL